jgi:NAD(P)H-flavin reductase
MVFALAGVAGLGYLAYTNMGGTGKGKTLENYLASADPALWAESKPGNPGIDGKTWTPVKVKAIQHYNDNTAIYELAFTGEGADQKTSGLTTASCLIVRSPEGENAVNDDKGKPVIRPYTPVSPPAHKGSLDLIVKSYPEGKISKWFAGLKPGDEVLLKGPIVKTAYEPNAVDKAVFVAGGSGITPAWQLINHALALPDDKTKFTLLYANVTEKDILLRKEWDALAAKYPGRLQVVYFLDNAPSGWKGENGYVTAEHINKYFPRAEGDKVKAYVCGPPGQYKAISGAKDGMKQGEVAGALKDLGYTSEEVFKF